jgi:high-affinity nickel-transport protein
MLAIFDDGANAPKAAGLCGALIAVNLLVWAWAFAAFRSYPMLLATALIAYGFGLRHAVDADHIAAIDNATRKLMQEGKRPITVGLFFSLGHSTVVFAASLVIALSASSLQQRFPGLIEVGGVVGTLVSVFFLMGIAIINFFVLVGVYRIFQRVRGGKRYTEEELNDFLAPRGLFGRLLSGILPADFPQLAYVSARVPVWARFRYRDGDRPARDLGRGSIQGTVRLVDLGVPRAVYRGDVAGR